MAQRRPVDVRQSTSGIPLQRRCPREPAAFPISVGDVRSGVNSESRLGGISIGGSSGSENQFVSDGVTTTDLTLGTAGRGFALEVIDELQVKSSGPTAEHSGTTGGVINIVTRSGGSVYPRDCRCARHCRSASGEGAPRPAGQSLRSGRCGIRRFRGRRRSCRPIRRSPWVGRGSPIGCGSLPATCRMSIAPNGRRTFPTAPATASCAAPVS